LSGGIDGNQPDNVFADRASLGNGLGNPRLDRSAKLPFYPQMDPEGHGTHLPSVTIEMLTKG